MIIRGGTVVTAHGVEKADIAIAGEQIVAVGLNLTGDGEEIDASRFPPRRCARPAW